MREVIYKNLTSLAQRKKDIFLKEIFEKNGVIAKTEKRCFYFIKEIKKLGKSEDLEKWIKLQNDNKAVDGRHFYILKRHDDENGEDRLVCKIAGTFYAVTDNSVYTIAFLHSFKVSVMKASLI